MSYQQSNTLYIPNFAKNKKIISDISSNNEHIKSGPHTTSYLCSRQYKPILNIKQELNVIIPSVPISQNNSIQDNKYKPTGSTLLKIPKIGTNKIKDEKEIPIRPQTYMNISQSKIPRIGITYNSIKDENIMIESSSLNKLNEDDPWLPIKVEGFNDVKIASITPIGTISLVPTCNNRPQNNRKIPMSPNIIKSFKQSNNNILINCNKINLNVIEPNYNIKPLTLNILNKDNNGNKITDPLLTTAIYLDRTDDRGYKYVADHMKKLSENTLQASMKYSTQLKGLLNVKGKVTDTIFEQALSIYENNQVFYQDRIDDGLIPLEQIKYDLTNLEIWFCQIIEPISKDDINSWKERESMKLLKGISSYCDPELYKYITPLSFEIKNIIKSYNIIS